MGFKFNPLTGQLDLVNSSSAGSATNIAKFTLSGTDISNKFVTLSVAPITPSLVSLQVVGGVEQDYGVDFSISGTQLTWNGLTLDGFLETGDKLVVIYN